MFGCRFIVGLGTTPSGRSSNEAPVNLPVLQNHHAYVRCVTMPPRRIELRETVEPRTTCNNVGRNTTS